MYEPLIEFFVRTKILFDNNNNRESLSKRLLGLLLAKKKRLIVLLRKRSFDFEELRESERERGLTITVVPR